MFMTVLLNEKKKQFSAIIYLALIDDKWFSKMVHFFIVHIMHIYNILY